MVDQIKTNQEVEKRVITYLESQGFQVSTKAQLRGQSGIEHTFDMLAQRDNGITQQTIAIYLFIKGAKESEASTIFDFANKAYDVGIKEKVLIAIPRVEPETKQLAEKQRIKVIDEEKIESLRLDTPEHKVTSSKTFRFESKEQIVDSLVKMGVPLGRLSMSGATSTALTNDEVQVFVR